MTQFQHKFLLFFSISTLVQFTLVQSVCLIKYPGSAEISPIYKKLFGKYSVELPYNDKDIEINEGEIIESLCRTNFSSISYNSMIRDRYGYTRQHVEIFKNLTSIRLQCLNNQLYFNNSILLENILECTKLKWSIYDANETYEWCEKNENAKTFLLAVKSNQDHHILAGICYNLNEWSLQTITYNVTTPKQNDNIEMLRDITKTELKSYQSLGDDLWNLKTTTNLGLTEIELQEQLTQLSETNSWLHLANYEMSSLVQGVSYENYFNRYADILNTIWWRNLRLGNWKLFMNTLENYAYNNSFQLYTGTSGVVKIPTKTIGDYSVLELKNGYLNKTVSAYIWTYLTSIDNQNEDFIIVGYNSPFAEFFNLSEVVFCPNICSEIPWLKEIYSSFRFATAGIMFCCSTDFMKQTNYLQGLPLEVLTSRALLKQKYVTEIENSTTTTLNSNDVETTTNQIVDDDISHGTESLLEVKSIANEKVDFFDKSDNI